MLSNYLSLLHRSLEAGIGCGNYRFEFRQSLRLSFPPVLYYLNVGRKGSYTMAEWLVYVFCFILADLYFILADYLVHVHIL